MKRFFSKFTGKQEVFEFSELLDLLSFVKKSNKIEDCILNSLLFEGVLFMFNHPQLQHSVSIILFFTVLVIRLNLALAY